MIDPKKLFGNDYQSFYELDPFNKNQLVEGFISRKANEYYGALIITKVNEKTVKPQLIMGSPKMRYPFVSRTDSSRNYTFPSVKNIEIYEKLDGTNVLAYFYYDDIGTRYLTYKTRLRPFLSSSRFGDFYNMWKEVATPYFDEIKKTMQKNKCNLSFELYGARNPHLIVYSNSLDHALLFGVTPSGNIISPDGILTTLPKVTKLKDINKDYIFNYESLQKELQDKLKKQEEGYYSGTEGAVWYLQFPDARCIQIKCKPETIEAIHFSAGAGGLAKNVVIATCWNAFENMEIPTVEFIKQLLLEEFKLEIIEAKHYLIEKCLDFVIKESYFRDKVIEEYRKTGLNIILNKVEVMRQISSKFTRERMGKVYSIIVNLA